MRDYEGQSEDMNGVNETNDSSTSNDSNYLMKESFSFQEKNEEEELFLLFNHDSNGIYENYSLFHLTLILLLNFTFNTNLSKSTVRFKTEKKRNIGRKRKDCQECNGNKSNNVHDKYTIDNIKKKIRGHFLIFLVELLNCALSYYKFELEFHHVKNPNYDKETKNDEEDELKEDEIETKTVGQIICQPLNGKYTTMSAEERNEYNKKIIEKVQNHKVLNNIFAKKFFDFFDIYYHNRKSINAKDYGANKDEIITFSSKVKTFEDLMNKPENTDES